MAPIRRVLIWVVYWIVGGTVTITVSGFALWGPPLEGWSMIGLIASAISCAVFGTLYRKKKVYGIFVAFWGGFIGGAVGAPLALWITNRGTEYAAFAAMASAALAAVVSAILALLSRGIIEGE
jgi:fermentation-respiration switch protein FrsA (DUF1100 family)